MDIHWLGFSCFRIKNKDVVVITDPFPKTGAVSMGKQTANIVTVSHHHPNHDYVSGVSGDPAVIDAPGEYEVSGTLITGLNAYQDEVRGAEQGKNTIFLIEFSDLAVCHLGNLGHMPTSEQMEVLNGVDVLLAPAGGRSLSTAAIAELVSQIEPKLLIPMDYKVEGVDEEIEGLDALLRAMGSGEVEPQPKATITRSSLGDDTQLMVLSR